MQVINKLIFLFPRALEGEDTYIVLVNLGDDEALVDLSQFYSNLPEVLSVAVASVESGYDFRDQVSSNEVTISGKVGLVLSTGGLQYVERGVRLILSSLSMTRNQSPIGSVTLKNNNIMKSTYLSEEEGRHKVGFVKLLLRFESPSEFQ
uniref:Uncharacterized protein n=1 Tax=Timema tahoe TaxID=61484 RepID=A0A7R9I8S1_9NEOP|nr:unnamed protein product [Timema tahoe]